MRVNTPAALGDAVHERRVQLGLTQTALAQKMGVSRVWVSQFENGKGTAHVRLVLDALAVLGLTLTVQGDVEESLP